MVNKKSTAKDEDFVVVAHNKKARHDYEIIDTIEAGLVLKGSEVKSLRAGGVNLRDSYVRFKSGEAFIIGCHISPYSHSRIDEVLATRDRKLLLHRQELRKLDVKVTQKGLTLIPLRLYFKDGKCKLEVATGKGKKLHDKRETTKRREADREMARNIKKAMKSR